MEIVQIKKMRPKTGEEEIKQMHCPHLLHIDNSCDVFVPKYAPSEFEVDEYCATEQHLRCPLYRDYLLRAVGQFLRPRPDSDAKVIHTK